MKIAFSEIASFSKVKKRIRFENTPRRILTSHMPEFLLWEVHILIQTSYKALRSQWSVPLNLF